MITQKINIQHNSDFHTANIFGVGVNAVSLAASNALDTAFSKTEEKENIYRTNPNTKLPTFLIGFVLFLAAVMKVTAVLIKGIFLLINAVLEIAPRGILVLLSLINFIFSYCSLSSVEWPMKENDEEDNPILCLNNLPFFLSYVQQDLLFYQQ